MTNGARGSPRRRRGPVIEEMERRAKHPGVVNAGILWLEQLLADPPVTADRLVTFAKRHGYQLSPEGEAHVRNDWGNENGHGWFGNILDPVARAFLEALKGVRATGLPLQITWWDGGIETGVDPRVYVQGGKVCLDLHTATMPEVGPTDSK